METLYNYSNFEDSCQNGLQVEGKDSIEKIIFGVSFNMPFLLKAMEEKPDALIVHHGIFQQGVFKLKGPLKEKIQLLLENGISLFGIHLPMDAHPVLGHNALLLTSIGAGNQEPLDVGFTGRNTGKKSLDEILDTFHHQLHPKGGQSFESGEKRENSDFFLRVKYGFTILENGPSVPNKIAVMSGGSSGFYEKAIEKGADTFFGGDIKEKIPAISLETHTNFINLGHYYSEKPGVLALMNQITDTFDVSAAYIEIPNPI